MTTFQRKTFNADVALVYWLAEGEKMNYKQPPKMKRESMPTPQDWNANITVTIKYLQTITSQEFVEENVLPPAEWEARSKSNDCVLFTSFLNSPVKKRSFNPIKTEPVLRSPLFPAKK